MVWIVMENHSYSEIAGNSAAPFENQLASECGLATNYFAISHPSLPNYVAMTSGSTQGIADDNDPSSHPLNVENIFHQLPGGASRSLEESMPSNCYPTNSGEYAVRHNPEAYYTNLGTDCHNYDVPLGSTPDLSAKFTFVTPNVCDDMHDCSVSTGDTWLQGFMGNLFQTSQWQAGNTAVFITFDEDDSSQNNHVYTAVIAPSVAPGTQSSAHFDHYSLLRTTEDLLGLPAIGNAASATGMEWAFDLAPGAVVSGVSPTQGPAAGGTAVTITGSGFVAGDRVVIGQGNGAGAGAIPATGVSVVSPTEITATTGGGAKPGTWNVFVIAPNGSVSHVVSGDQFTYTP